MARQITTLMALTAVALVMPNIVQAQRYRPCPPIHEVYSLSMALSNQAAALTYDVERVLCDCRDYDDVLEELCEVADELDDLNRALRDAARNPRKWKRVCKQAEDVEEELCELDEEIREALDRMNRYRPRQVGFAPRSRIHYRSNYRFVFQTGLPLPPTASRSLSGIPRSVPYLGSAQGYVPQRVGYELLSQVQSMRSIAREIHRLAHR